MINIQHFNDTLFMFTADSKDHACHLYQFGKTWTIRLAELKLKEAKANTWCRIESNLVASILFVGFLTLYSANR